VGWLINVALLLFSSILFRAQSASDAWVMMTRIATAADGRAVGLEWFYLLCGLLAIHAFCFWKYKEDLLQRLGWPGRVAAVSAMLVAIATLGATARPFIYFQF
jgi:hypothetical protein